MSADQPSFAAAVTCIDGRVHAALTAWVKDRCEVDHVDLLTHAGADLAVCCAEDEELAHVRRQLDISRRAHRPGTLVIAGHADCAANPAPEEVHRDHLRRAAGRAREWAGGDLEVVAAWVGPDGAVEEVEQIDDGRPADEVA